MEVLPSKHCELLKALCFPNGSNICHVVVEGSEATKKYQYMQGAEFSHSIVYSIPLNISAK